MKGDKAVIDSLQDVAQGLASISGQYQSDVQNLHAMGLEWLQKKVKKFYSKTEDYLREVMDRLFYFGVDPTYQVDKVVGADSVTSILQRNYKSVYDLYDKVCGYRKMSWDVKADPTTDLYEHISQCLEKQVFCMERELALIKKLGEDGYVGARLEDA